MDVVAHIPRRKPLTSIQDVDGSDVVELEIESTAGYSELSSQADRIRELQ